MTLTAKIVIEQKNGGWMVYLPNGDFAWQPSKQFAESFAKNYLRLCEIGTCRLEPFPDTPLDADARAQAFENWIDPQ